MKMLNVYGVELTELENMIFSKWVSNEGISMNTKTEIERKEITLNWLNKYGNSNKI
jgi:hypothetical protein